MTEFGVLDVLSSTEQAEFYARVRRRHYRRREVLFYEADLGDGAMIIAAGSLAGRKSGPDGETGTIAVLGPGDVVGEMSLIDASARRPMTVVALDATDVLILEREVFAEWRRSNPGIDRFLVSLLASRIRRLDEQLALALLGTSEARIAIRLAALSDTCPEGRDGGRGIALTQQDLASLTGTSRATVNRVLGELAERRVIEVGRGRVRVLDRAQMLKLVR